MAGFATIRVLFGFAEGQELFGGQVLAQAAQGYRKLVVLHVHQHHVFHHQPDGLEDIV